MESGFQLQLNEILSLLVEKFPYATSCRIKTKTDGESVTAHAGTGRVSRSFDGHERAEIIPVTPSELIYEKDRFTVSFCASDPKRPVMEGLISPVRVSIKLDGIHPSSTFTNMEAAKELAAKTLLANLPDLIDLIRRDNDLNQNSGLQAIIEELRS